MIKKVVIGSRKSSLALAQTGIVQHALTVLNSNVEFGIKTVTTTGDKDLTSSLNVIGGKGVFVKEIEKELLNGTIDIAVHSLKDVPSILPNGLMLGAIPPRDSAFDCLLSLNKYESLDDLPKNARIGTNSTRRRAQLLTRRPDLDIVPIRGNIETRLGKLESENLDGVVLAVSGLNRLQNNLDLDKYNILKLKDIIVPSVGQGALAIECREDDLEILRLITTINDNETARCVHEERKFLDKLNGNCTSPIGGYCSFQDHQYTFHGVVLSDDGDNIFESKLTKDISDGLGLEAANEILNQGAVI